MTQSSKNEDLYAEVKALRQRQIFLGGPKKIGEAINQLIARRGYAQIETSEACFAAWKVVAGEALSRISRPGNLRRNVLEIIVANSIALQEITFRKMELLKGMNEQLPEFKIKDLRFKVGQF